MKDGVGDDVVSVEGTIVCYEVGDVILHRSLSAIGACVGVLTV